MTTNWVVVTYGSSSASDLILVFKQRSKFGYSVTKIVFAKSKPDKAVDLKVSQSNGFIEKRRD